MLPPTPAGAALTLAMSALGQKRTFYVATAMAALLLKADIFGGRFVLLRALEMPTPL